MHSQMIMLTHIDIGLRSRGFTYIHPTPTHKPPASLVKVVVVCWLDPPHTAENPIDVTIM